MNISSASMTDTLAGVATDMQASEVMSQIGVAVLKQIQDQQEQQAASLLNMINQTPSLHGTGSILDISI